MAATPSPNVALDPRWRGRALFLDLLALAALVLSAVAMGLGLRSYLITSSTGADVGRTLLLLGLAGALFVLSFAWIAGRLVLAGMRDATRR
jgi:hypothetical protein